ncbi:DUF2963 domain-containing protein [Candidatus Phytoplasma pruni]|uniref:DUF2963 domain-containing protein n=1 Tax=Candidatus Phytoplasma pruni TaxID=479893 RepID=A0A851HCI1_9MOLU|nr:alpha-glucosyltransferase N-terminal domain-containing protein [Candidatus Phytoplasma pruni]NWN45761.1 DUF2963 domain-containing protein [Candidatus Phytoplasma pruni]
MLSKQLNPNQTFQKTIINEQGQKIITEYNASFKQTQILYFHKNENINYIEFFNDKEQLTERKHYNSKGQLKQFSEYNPETGKKIKITLYKKDGSISHIFTPNPQTNQFTNIYQNTTPPTSNPQPPTNTTPKVEQPPQPHAPDKKDIKKHKLLQTETAKQLMKKINTKNRTYTWELNDKTKNYQLTAYYNEKSIWFIADFSRRQRHLLTKTTYNDAGTIAHIDEYHQPGNILNRQTHYLMDGSVKVIYQRDPKTQKMTKIFDASKQTNNPPDEKDIKQHKLLQTETAKQLMAKINAKNRTYTWELNDKTKNYQLTAYYNEKSIWFIADFSRRQHHLLTKTTYNDAGTIAHINEYRQPGNVLNLQTHYLTDGSIKAIFRRDPETQKMTKIFDAPKQNHHAPAKKKTRPKRKFSPIKTTPQITTFPNVQQQTETITKELLTRLNITFQKETSWHELFVNPLRKNDLMGDAVLRLFIIELIYNSPQLNPCNLGELISNKLWINVMKHLNLIPQSATYHKNYADNFEALFGVVYYDRGINEAKKLFQHTVVKFLQDNQFIQ